MHSHFPNARIGPKRNAHGARQGVRRGGTGVLLGVVAAEVDLLLGVPDVCLPAPGAPAQARHRASCVRTHRQEYEVESCPASIEWTCGAISALAAASMPGHVCCAHTVDVSCHQQLKMFGSCAFSGILVVLSVAM